MLLECIWVSSLLKGPSLSFSPRLILLQYPLVCWIARIYEDIQFIHFILKSPKPSLSVQYHSRCLNRHYADLLLSIVSRGSKNDLIPINNWVLRMLLCIYYLYLDGYNQLGKDCQLCDNHFVLFGDRVPLCCLGWAWICDIVPSILPTPVLGLGHSRTCLTLA